MKLVCPKCGQKDRGFTREWLIGETIDNDGKVVVPELRLDDTTLLTCLNDECSQQFSQSDAEGR